METDLYKARSLANCTKAAYDLFSTNLKSIVRRTWLPTAILALISACAQLINLTCPTLPDAVHGAPDSNIAWAVGYLLLLLSALPTGVWLITSVVSMLNGQPFKANLPRIARLFLYVMAIAFACGTVIGLGVMLPLALGKPDLLLHHPVASKAVVLLLAAIIAVCLIPTYYSVTKYYMEKQQRVGSILGKPYRRGWNHWGFLFAASLLVGIISYLLTYVVLMPVYLILLAQRTSLQGQIIGDPGGLPSYFNAMAFSVTLICTFLWVYIMIWCSMVFYYAYGTIETKIRARQQAANVATETVHDDRTALPTDIELK